MINDIKLEGTVTWEVKTDRKGDHYLLTTSIEHKYGKDYGKKLYRKIQAWNDTAREIESMNLKKGDKIVVSGRTEEWYNKETSKVTVSIVADKVEWAEHNAESRVEDSPF
jgi:single-stranded DNA-binding protein